VINLAIHWVALLGLGWKGKFCRTFEGGEAATRIFEETYSFCATIEVEIDMQFTKTL